jgi:hypothetical protein
MNDPKIREEFKKRYLSKVTKESCQIFDELGILKGDSIVDIAAITPSSLEGFEIKSGLDTLNRLPNQIICYNQVFDFITILTEPKYVEKVQALVPEFWGIIQVEEYPDQTVDFKPIRNPHINPQVDKRKVLELLWSIECHSILHELNIKGHSKLRRKKLWDLLDEKLDHQQIKEFVYKYLTRRDLWKTAL